MIDDQFNGHRSNLPVVAERHRAPAAVPIPVQIEVPDAPVPLSQYLWILRRHRWKILAAIITCTIASMTLSLRLTPIYESTATIDIDRRSPTGILGQESAQSTTNDADEFIMTQIKLIQSDSVLRPVARKYKLRETERGKAGLPLHQTLDEAPVVLRDLKVTRPANTYILLVSYRSSDRVLAANVANGIAESFLDHTYMIRYKAAAGLSRFMEKQLEELKAKMERSSADLAQFERELNVINPEEKTNILSSRLLQLNTEYTNAQADRVKKEAALASMQSGTLEAAQVSSQGETLKRLIDALNDAQQKFAAVKIHYGANHPEYRKVQSEVAETQRLLNDTRQSIGQRVEVEFHQAENREQMLKNAVAETKADFDRLNARSFDYQSLKREAETHKKLYEELVRKIKEATINASFQNSSIRIADPALPSYRPVFPDIPLNTALALLLSTLIATGMAVLADVLDNTIRDPEQVTRSLKATMVGTLPMIKGWRGHQAMPSMSSRENVSSTVRKGISGFDEAIRTVRNSILLTDFDRRLRSVLLTSAAPAEGKSTVAAHLAMAHAEQGNRTLLIDGDLRRPSIHKFFQVSNHSGLSKTLVHDLPWKEAVMQPIPGVSLFVLPAGPATRRAADLVGKGITQILDEAAEEFDLVILDAPPLLGFPEPLQMAASVDGVIVVTRAGHTNRTAVNTLLNSLNHLRANVLGLVLNEVNKEMSQSYYYYGYYHRYYTDNSPQKVDKPA